MPPAAPEVPLEFSDDQDKVVLALAGFIKTAALTTLALGGLSLLAGLVFWFWWGLFWAGVWAIVVGAPTAFLGLVLLSTSTDMRYVSETKGYDKIHLLNALTSINIYLKTLIGLSCLVGVVQLFRLFG